jgi:2,4-dienoyl-CoA reductase-like NADH-dependent reductase (Old Yellow Enzyme family)
MTDWPGAELLFRPFRIRNVTLRNRIVMAPMTRMFAKNGVHDPRAVAYYQRRAAAGTGLIISEGTAPPHPVAAAFTNIPGLASEAAINAWREVSGAVRSVGGSMLVQLWHAGLLRNPAASVNPHEPSIGPSGFFPDQSPTQPPGQPMTQADIDSVIESFASAAQICQRLGFAGVELHGAHGYLFDQFFWKETNRRTDRYGGGIRERTRFAVETIQEVRRRTGPDFVISLRFSQFKPPLYVARLAHAPQELEQFLEPLAGSGLDLFHVSTRRFWLAEFEGSDLSLAAWTRKITAMPVITVGSVGLAGAFDPRKGVREEADKAGLDQLFRMLERGDFDLVAVGRSLLANPNWAEIVRREGADKLLPYRKEAVTNLY